MGSKVSTPEILPTSDSCYTYGLSPSCIRLITHSATHPSPAILHLSCSQRSTGVIKALPRFSPATLAIGTSVWICLSLQQLSSASAATSSSFQKSTICGLVVLIDRSAPHTESQSSQRSRSIIISMCDCNVAMISSIIFISSCPNTCR
jgi:hypothetical protein